jgi:26S proteasome regulatory subunit N13
MGGSQIMQAQQPSVALSDILAPASLAPLFEPANSGVLASLQDYLPSDLPTDSSSTPEETLRRVIQSGPFQSAVKQLDRAFATGLLGQLMPGFGLPEEAGLSVEAFLRAIHDKAEREQREHSE